MTPRSAVEPQMPSVVPGRRRRGGWLTPPPTKAFHSLPGRVWMQAPSYIVFAEQGSACKIPTGVALLKFYILARRRKRTKRGCASKAGARRCACVRDLNVHGKGCFSPRGTERSEFGEENGLSAKEASDALSAPLQKTLPCGLLGGSGGGILFLQNPWK